MAASLRRTLATCWISSTRTGRSRKRRLNRTDSAEPAGTARCPGALARMHVILTPVGSAGDVNPFLIVGRELRRRGHRVTLIAPVVFAGAASNAGLDLQPLGTAEEFEDVTNDPDLWHPRRGLEVILSRVARNLRRAYAALDAVYEPDKTMLLS